MTTAASVLIDECLDLLYGSTRQRLNTLSAALTDTVGTSLSFTYPIDGIADGSLLSIDQELMYVIGTPSVAAKTCTVIRGARGSTAATHSNGAQVSINPKFTRYAILRQMNHDLNDLTGQGLFQVVSVDLTYNSAIEGYDITGATDVIGILDVVRDTIGPDNSWPRIPPSRYSLRRAAETGDFTSGFGLVLYQGVDPGRAVRVRYATSLGQFATEASTTASVGLPDSAIDLPPLGAAMALMMPRESQRDAFEAQPDTRRPSEVPPGALLGAARQWAAWRAERIKVEVGNLHQDWPMVKR